MKNVINLLLLMFFITSLSAQNLNLESGKMYTIHFKNGNIVKGRITSISEQKISCNLNDGPYPTTYDFSEITSAEEVEYPKSGSIGAGIGAAYGIVGVNGELALFKYFSMSAGLGTSIYAGIAYAVGGRLYFSPPGAKWRPRVSVHYGTNSIIYISGSTDIKEKYEGVTIGAGLLGMFGENRKSGFDCEIVYLASRGNFAKRWAEIQNTYPLSSDSMIATGRIKVLIGYRIAF